MWLTLDIGNSTLKAGLFDNGRLIRHRSWLIDDGCEVGLSNWIQKRSITRTGLCSVVPAITERIIDVVDLPSVLVVSSGLELPFDVAYERPDLLGTDRIAAAAAAWVRYGPSAPVVVVDAGTTATVDVIHHGTFLGGSIVAGPSMLVQALAERTAALPIVPLELPNGPYGQSTTSAIQHGVMHGFTDAVQGAILRASSALPSPPVVVATGGWHQMLANCVAAINNVLPHLVLIGIWEIMRLNAATT